MSIRQTDSINGNTAQHRPRPVTRGGGRGGGRPPRPLKKVTKAPLSFAGERKVTIYVNCTKFVQWILRKSLKLLSYFKAKMHLIRFQLGKLAALPQTLAGFQRGLFIRGGEGREGEVERRGPQFEKNDPHY